MMTYDDVVSQPAFQTALGAGDLQTMYDLYLVAFPPTPDDDVWKLVEFGRFMSATVLHGFDDITLAQIEQKSFFIVTGKPCTLPVSVHSSTISAYLAPRDFVAGITLTNIASGTTWVINGSGTFFDSCYVEIGFPELFTQLLVL